MQPARLGKRRRGGGIHPEAVQVWGRQFNSHCHTSATGCAEPPRTREEWGDGPRVAEGPAGGGRLPAAGVSCPSHDPHGKGRWEQVGCAGPPGPLAAARFSVLPPHTKHSRRSASIPRWIVQVKRKRLCADKKNLYSQYYSQIDVLRSFLRRSRLSPFLSLSVPLARLCRAIYRGMVEAELQPWHVAHSVAAHDLAGGEGGYGATVAGPQGTPQWH
jgi:hypothetical protein